MRYTVAAVFLCLVMSCSTLTPNYSTLRALPTPSAWHAPSTWTFVISDRKSTVLGGFTIELLTDDATTCEGGDWKIARLVSTTLDKPPLKHWYTDSAQGGAGLHAAYQIEGRYIYVLLNAPVCDNDWALRGEVTDRGAQGTFGTEEMFGGKLIGEFRAVAVPQ
jgi:hypothetical protein